MRASAATSSAGPTGKVTGSSLYALSASPIDDRTVEVTVTPPGKPAAGQFYWFFVEVDWRDGNTDYYPREQLTGGSQTLTITVPANATMEADRTGRVYRLIPPRALRPTNGSSVSRPPRTTTSPPTPSAPSRPRARSCPSAAIDCEPAYPLMRLMAEGRPPTMR